MTPIRIHPGEILREEFLPGYNLNASQLAAALDVSRDRISKIVREERDVTPDTAVRLARYFGTSVEYWLNMQMSYDLAGIDQDAIARVVAPREVA